MFKKVVLFFLYILIPFITMGNVYGGELVIGFYPKSRNKTIQDDFKSYFIGEGFNEVSSHEANLMYAPLLLGRTADEDRMFFVSLRECPTLETQYVIIEIINAINGEVLYYRAKEVNDDPYCFKQIIKDTFEVIEDLVKKASNEKPHGFGLGILRGELCDDFYFTFIEKILKTDEISLLDRSSLEECRPENNLNSSRRVTKSFRSKLRKLKGAEVLLAISQGESQGFQVTAIDVEDGKIICEHSISSDSDIDEFIKLLSSKYKKAD